MAGGVEMNAFGGLEGGAFLTGTKRYGAGLTSAATSGSLSTDGYDERERRKRERRRAIQQRMLMMSDPGTIAPNGAPMQPRGFF